MKLLDWLFGKAEQRDRNNAGKEAGRTLSPAMPMSAAGAELSADGPKSRTEEKLQQAAERNQSN